MFVAGFIAAVVIAGPLGFLLGRFDRTDRRVAREVADIRPALRRSR